MRTFTHTASAFQRWLTGKAWLAWMVPSRQFFIIMIIFIWCHYYDIMLMYTFSYHSPFPCRQYRFKIADFRDQSWAKICLSWDECWIGSWRHFLTIFYYMKPKIVWAILIYLGSRGTFHCLGHLLFSVKYTPIKKECLLLPFYHIEWTFYLLFGAGQCIQSDCDCQPLKEHARIEYTRGFCRKWSSINCNYSTIAYQIQKRTLWISI